MDMTMRLKMLSRLFVKAQQEGQGKAEELFANVVNAIEDKMDSLFEEELSEYVLELQHMEGQAISNLASVKKELKDVRKLLPQQNKEIED